MYNTWDDAAGRATAVAHAAQALNRVEPVVRSHASNIYMNIGPGGLSVRDEVSRRDYEAFRPGEKLPTKPKEVISACMSAYEQIGIVKNIIDLMADFACQGVDLVHPNERIEKFYKEWFRRVKGKNRSERFLNLLYRTGNVLVRRQTAKLPVRVEDQMRRSTADPDVEVEDEVKVLKREIPWRYRFVNPLSVEVVSDELTLFAGEDDFVFAVKIPRTLAAKIKAPKTPQEKALVAKLPADVVAAVRNGGDLIQLDPTKVKAFYYKRDDWDVWASPMANAILADLQMLQKMKLADLAALDGAISSIRVWKLGNLEAKLMPNDGAINRLAEMLANNVGGGVMDLVWGPDLELVETSTEVHKFLGETKYAPVLTSIYAGLGIPPTLTGSSTSSGFTNNFISLQTLIERLEYGRDRLREFWEEEIRIVQRAMGFRFPATLTFDHMTLTDENTRLNLLVNLADRDIISTETIRDVFGLEPDIEDIRVRREVRRRKDGLMPEKASPYHTAEKDHQKKMAFIAQGDVTPSEVGVELDDPKPGEKSLFDKQSEQAVKQSKLDMQATKQEQDHQFRTEKLQLKHGVHPAQVAQSPQQPGRPKQAKDGKKRKQKTVTPRTSAQFFQTFAWAENAQARIGQLASVPYLKSLGKKSLRELTDAEARNFEEFKFFVLCQLEPGTEVGDRVVAACATKKLEIPSQVALLLKETVAKHAESTGREPSAETLRRFQAGTFALWKMPDDGPENPA